MHEDFTFENSVGYILGENVCLQKIAVVQKKTFLYY